MGAVAVLAGASLAGCNTQSAGGKDGDEQAAKDGKKDGDGSGKGASASASAARAFDEATVPAGETDGVWTAGYRVRRLAGDTGKSYLEAAELCRGQGMALCSDVQWSRACASDARVGALESWTASWAGDAVVVRGGGGCSARKTAPGGQGQTSRAGLCCERAIGIRSGNKNASFVEAAHADQLRFERALSAQDMTALDDIYGKGLFMEGNPDKGMTHDAALKAQRSWFTAHPKQWTLYDVCDASVANILCPEPAGKSVECPGLVLDCDMVSVLGDQLTVVKQRVGWWKGEEEQKNHVWDIRHGKRSRKLAKL